MTSRSQWISATAALLAVVAALVAIVVLQIERDRQRKEFAELYAEIYGKIWSIDGAAKEASTMAKLAARTVVDQQDLEGARFNWISNRLVVVDARALLLWFALTDEEQIRALDKTPLVKALKTATDEEMRSFIEAVSGGSLVPNQSP